MTIKHIHNVQTGDKITTCGDTTFDNVFVVRQVCMMPNGKPYLIRGESGKAIMTGNNDDRIVSVL